MKQKDVWINRILRWFMTGIGMVLVVLLLWKAVDRQGEDISGRGILNLAAEQMEKYLGLLWRGSYPAAGNAFEKQKRAGGEKVLIEAVFSGIPLYRYLKQEPERSKGYEEIDPSYQTYVSNREFYEEHQYLFLYGNEETNQEAASSSEQPGQEGEPGLPPPGPSDTPAYAVKEGIPKAGVSYVMEQLADYDFLMKHFYSVHTTATAGRDLMDASKFLSKDFTLAGDNSSPQILIYHTHSQETFADYGPDRKEATVVGIGNYLTELLTAKGYSVIHDTSVYDLDNGKLDRNKAYTYALDGITKILQENPSIEVILDVHRDGVSEKLHLVSEVNGKPTAPIMFFNGVSQTPDGPIEYLPNPYREDNLAFSLQMQLNAAAYYPGFTRKIYIKGLRYNLHLRPRSALIEVGAQTNTYEEARNAMEPLAELLDMVLQGN